MTWFELDPSFNKYSQSGGDLRSETVSIHATLDPISKISVDAGTDWAVVMIGVGTVASAILTAIFSYRGQQRQTLVSAEGLKNQVRANAANLRNIWMEQLRVVSSEFIQKIALSVARARIESQTKADIEYVNSHREQALLLQIKMKLYVGTSSILGKKIVDLSDKVLVDLHGGICESKGFDEILHDLSDLEDLVVEQLEQAWMQAKEDLGFL